tara:strand:- start:193 stop:405 length:213 start_codon:yes stop_codon:yes gene_type:complete
MTINFSPLKFSLLVSIFDVSEQIWLSQPIVMQKQCQMAQLSHFHHFFASFSVSYRSLEIKQNIAAALLAR